MHLDITADVALLTCVMLVGCACQAKLPEIMAVAPARVIKTKEEKKAEKEKAKAAAAAAAAAEKAKAAKAAA